MKIKMEKYIDEDVCVLMSKFHLDPQDYLNLSLPHLDTPPSSCGSSLTSDVLSPH